MILELALLAAQAEKAPELQVRQPSPIELGSAGSLAAIENEVQALYRKLHPALVQVRTRYAWADEDGKERDEFLTVSGIVLADGGLVIAPGDLGGENRGLEVIDRTNQAHSARFVAQAEHLGLSLLVAETLPVRGPVLGCADAMSVGAITISLGNGLGLEGTLSIGFLTGRERQIAQVDGLMQITNNINLGDGGGLVANSKGQLVGILFTSLEEAARRYAASSKSVTVDLTTSRGVSFAIPVDRVVRAFQPYLPAAVAGRREMGVRLNPEPVFLDSPEFAKGLRVMEVLKGTPASRAGLLRGDILLRAGDVPCATLDCLAMSLRRASESLPVWVMRGGKKIKIELRFQSSERATFAPGRRILIREKESEEQRKPAESPPQDDDERSF